MLKVASFDVFDTCLTRRVAVPSNVFYEVALRVFLRLGAPFSPSAAEDFVAARMQAERIARKQSGREDIGLAEIWRNLTETMGWPEDESLARCELEVEEELLIPILSVRQHVQRSREQGSRIIFVSDMYLPKEFIERLLLKHGFAQKGDGLYVSGDVGKTKGSGNLFKHLLEQENVPASNVWHAGDNQHTDYDVPIKMGIHAELFTRPKLTPAEISVMETNGESRPGTYIAGAMRAFRLKYDPKARKDIPELAAQFVAPFIMGFAIWVLRQAQQNGVKRLYFMSRDCQLIWKVARELAPQFGDIDCRYLYISRQALFLASANAISPEEMPWMEQLYKDPILGRLLALIELTYDDVESGFSRMAGPERGAYRLKSPEDWQYFWKALNEEPLKSRIMKLTVVRRETAIGYFESAGLFDTAPWAVVDLGWTLKCQQSLWKLLRRAKWQGQMSGYYLQLGHWRINRAEAGNTEAIFYQDAPDYPYASTTPSSHVDLIEHVIGCADHPTVHHYEKGPDGFSPVFVKVVDQPTLEFCRSLQDLVMEFVRDHPALVENFSDTEICRRILQALVTSFIRFPAKEVAGALRELPATFDQSNAESLIVNPLTMRNVALLFLPIRDRSSKLARVRTHFWPEGSLAVTPPNIRKIVEFAENLRGLPARFVRLGRSGIQNAVRWRS